MPRLFMFVVIVFVYIVVAKKYSFFGNIVGNFKKNIGKISTHTPFPISYQSNLKNRNQNKKKI